MEISMKNIPRDSTKYDLIRRLAYIFHGPGYNHHQPQINFEVYLYKESHRLGMGALTLPDIVIAERFLQEYGTQDSPKHCVLGGTRIKFSRSRKKPKQDIIEKLTRLPYKDPDIAEQEEQRRNRAKAGVVNIRQIQFGWFARDSVISIEWEHTCSPTGQLTFNLEGPPEILITTRAYDLPEPGFAVIRFPLSLIRYISVHHHSPSPQEDPEHFIYFNLYHPPSFEIEKDTLIPTSNERCSHLPLSGHETVAPYTSEIIRLVCNSAADLPLFRELYRIAQPRPVNAKPDTYDQPIERRNIFTQAAIDRVADFVCELDWHVAIQVEKLVRWQRVDVQEMVSLIPEIRSLIRLRGSEYAANVLRHFPTKLKNWDGESEDGERYSSIEHCFTEATKSYANSIAEDSDPELSRIASLSKDESLFNSYHVTITPTSYFPGGPFTDRSNSVIRWFDSSQHDHFLKVCFADEGTQKYRYDRNIDGDAYIRSRFGKYLFNGITIAGRKFNFLAYTQSSLKEHTVWFLKPFTVPAKNLKFKDLRTDSVEIDSLFILKQIGTQSFEGNLRRCPALYGARISQAFTASNASTIEVEETLLIDDIVTTDGKYNYTDGVGTMSKEFALQVWTELKATKRRTRNRIDPTIPAFQIRFGGSKGMLSVDYKLKGNVICVRPSMRKFASLTSTIEVVESFDRPRKVLLNRPLVMLLEGLGIPIQAFKNLQDKAIGQTCRATESLSTAARLLESFGLGNAFRLTSVLFGFSRLGVDDLIQADPFHKSLLEYAIHHILRELKHHTRIPIEDAWNLVGVADVHGFLEEGQVYAAVKPVNGPVQYLSGEVLVTRSPVIHPGDVQLARAIGKPPPGSCFEHEPLINTVVFSTKGSRPMPSMLGGGDLDGDTYNVIPLNLHPDLRPKFFAPPADYSGPQRKLVNQDCTLDDVTEFIIEYINSDLVGLIATRWLMIADQSQEGIFDRDCEKLAELHSSAVDYPKTGYPVDPETIPKLHFQQQPDWYAPETVDPSSSRFYESKRAIGVLAREITLQDMGSNIQVPRSEQRRRRGHPRVVSSSVTLYLNPFAQEDGLYRLLQKRLCDLEISIQDIEQDTKSDIFQIYQNYISNFEGLSTAYTLSSETALSEEEVILGTIAAKISNIKRRKVKMAELRNHTHTFINDIIYDLTAEDDLENIERAWSAYDLARKQVLQGTFGARSFQYIALGLLLGSLKELEEGEEGDGGTTGLKRKRSAESRLDWKRHRYTTAQRYNLNEDEYEEDGEDVDGTNIE